MSSSRWLHHGFACNFAASAIVCARIAPRLTADGFFQNYPYSPVFVQGVRQAPPFAEAGANYALLRAKEHRKCCEVALPGCWLVSKTLVIAVNLLRCHVRRAAGRCRSCFFGCIQFVAHTPDACTWLHGRQCGVFSQDSIIAKLAAALQDWTRSADNLVRHGPGASGGVRAAQGRSLVASSFCSAASHGT